jgi:hypothetical protein
VCEFVDWKPTFLPSFRRRPESSFFNFEPNLNLDAGLRRHDKLRIT